MVYNSFCGIVSAFSEKILDMLGLHTGNACLLLNWGGGGGEKKKHEHFFPFFFKKKKKKKKS